MSLDVINEKAPAIAPAPEANFDRFEHAEISNAPWAQRLIAAADAAKPPQDLDDIPRVRGFLENCSTLDGALGSALKKADEERDSWVRPLNTQVARINSRFKALLNPLTERRNALREKMQGVQREVQRRANEAAKAERDRIAQEALDRAARQEAEANEARQAQRAREEEAEALRKKAEADAAAGDEAAAAQARAESAAAASRAQELGNMASTKEAESHLAIEEAANTPPPAPAIPAGPTRGAYGSTTSFQEHWAFEVVDEDKIPRKWLTVDEKLINQAIKGKNGLREIAGLRIYDKGKVVTR